MEREREKERPWGRIRRIIRIPNEGDRLARDSKMAAPFRENEKYVSSITVQKAMPCLLKERKKRNEGWTSLDPSGRVEIFTNGGSGTDLDPSPPITMSTDETDGSWNDASMWRSEKWTTVWKERRKMAVDFYYYYYYFSTPCQPWITC